MLDTPVQQLVRLLDCQRSILFGTFQEWCETGNQQKAMSSRWPIPFGSFSSGLPGSPPAAPGGVERAALAPASRPAPGPGPAWPQEAKTARHEDEEDGAGAGGRWHRNWAEVVGWCLGFVWGTLWLCPRGGQGPGVLASFLGSASLFVPRGTSE